MTKPLEWAFTLLTPQQASTLAIVGIALWGGHVFQQDQNRILEARLDRQAAVFTEQLRMVREDLAACRSELAATREELAETRARLDMLLSGGITIVDGNGG